MKRLALSLTISTMLPLLLLTGTSEMIVIFLKATVAGANTGDPNSVAIPDATIPDTTTADTIPAESVPGNTVECGHYCGRRNRPRRHRERVHRARPRHHPDPRIRRRLHRTRPERHRVGCLPIHRPDLEQLRRLPPRLARATIGAGRIRTHPRPTNPRPVGTIRRARRLVLPARAHPPRTPRHHPENGNTLTIRQYQQAWLDTYRELAGGALPIDGCNLTGGGLGAIGTTVAADLQPAIAYAQAQLGKPYLWGGSGPDAFDCSGLTMRAYQQIDIALPHNSAAQANYGIPIDWRTTPHPNPVTSSPSAPSRSTASKRSAASSSSRSPHERIKVEPHTITVRTVSVPEAARIVGIGRSTLYEHVRAGLVPSLRIGRRVVIPTEVIEALLKSATTAR